MRKRLVQRVEQPQTAAVKLDGGLDLTSPTLDIQPGDMLLGQNYEAEVNGGYSRTGNYERFDGQPKPSEAEYVMLGFDAGSTEFPDGATVTGATSGATGIVMKPWTIDFTDGSSPIQVFDTITGAVSTETAEVVGVEVTSGSWGSGDAAGVLHLKEPSGDFDAERVSSSNGAATVAGPQATLALDSGTWGGGDAAGTLAMGAVSGTFQNDENLQVSAVTYAVADGSPLVGGATTDAVDNRSIQHAISNARALIDTVPGIGDILGVMALNGEVFAFRNNAGGTVAELSKATSSGWSHITLPNYIEFDAGSIAFEVGDTITGGTSGATATVDAVMVRSGVVGSGTQAGRLYISSAVGSFQNNENLQVSGVTNALSASVRKAMQLEIDGRYETVVDNFTGDPADRKIYGVDGVNPAFEFDGTNFYQLVTANTDDTPDHIAVHKQYLFLSFGPSVQHSGLGTPRDFSALAGGVEIATGDDVTGFAKASGDVLAMFNRSKTYLLYGAVSTEWERKEHSSESGAIANSIQSVGSPVYLDDRGLTMLQSVQDFGDFKEASLSRKVDPLLTTKKTTVTASMRVKEKNQYRIYFEDGSGLHVRLDRKEPSFTQVVYNTPVLCALSTEDTDGNEILFFGSDDGYVYQADVGRSADGAPIECLMRLPYWTFKTPRVKKRFTQAVLLLDSDGAAGLDFTAEYDYSTSVLPRGLTQAFSLSAGGGVWGLSIWGRFVWGAQSVGEAVAYLSGSGNNIGLLIRGYSAHEQGHTIQSVIVHYIPRGLKR